MYYNNIKLRKEYTMNKFITLLFAVLFTMWTIRLYYKLYDKKTRRYILFIGILIIFWMIIRIIKGIIDFPFLKRMCWYLYYLPLIFIPTLYYISSMSLLNKISKKNKLIIYSISTFLLLLVLTNDFHNLVFKFNNGITLHDDYTHFIVYYLISIWIFYLFSKSLIELATYRMKIKKDKKGFLPFIIILLGLTYTILYVLDIQYIRSINMSVVDSTLICLGIELAFYLDLIPNNSEYINKFINSTLDMAIVSLDGKIRYTTTIFKNIPGFILNDIKNKKVKNNYQDNNIIYDIKTNKDSYVILKKDLTSINNIKKEIKKKREELLKQQESLKIEEKTKKELYEIKLRNEVINKVEIKLSEKRLEAKKILMNKNVSISDLEKVKRIIIYSKKKSMLMISEINEDIYDEEGINVLLNELLKSMFSTNIKGFISINNKMTIKGSTMSLLYDIVYELIELNNNKYIDAFTTYNLNEFENSTYQLIQNQNGFYNMVFSECTTNRGHLLVYPAKISSSFALGDYIKSVIIETTLSVNIYSGTVIKIYGVRA